MFKTIFFFALTILFANPACGQEKWRWFDKEASLMHYFLRAPNNYRIKIVRGVMSDPSDLEVQINSGTQTVHHWKTHPKGAFLIKNSVVIYAKFSTSSSGCELRSFDLEDQKENWRVQLKGLGEVAHSEYYNRINMAFRNNHVVVYGNEAYGQYIEVRDCKTGELVSNKVGSGGHRKFDD